MFVGHTVQKEGINGACEEKVFRIDTGISSYYGGLEQAILIKNGNVHIIE